jgi:hypothetical protein
MYTNFLTSLKFYILINSTKQTGMQFKDIRKFSNILLIKILILFK